MNNNIDLTEILKDCPKGTKLYSTVHGEVKFYYADINSEYPIRVRALSKQGLYYNIFLTKYGTFSNDYADGECILFPSKDQRDWSKFKAQWKKAERFDPNTLNPFDKVLVRDHCKIRWTISLFSYVDDIGRVYTGPINWRQVIPYNDETKSLLGKLNEAPEYYRYWED